MAKTRTYGTNEAGYTLLELLIVLALSALVVSVALPLISAPRPATEVRAAIDTASGVLREARARAVRTNRPVSVHLDVTGRKIAIADMAPVVLGGDDLGIELTTAQSLIVDEERAALMFMPDGSSTGGHITLRRDGLSRTLVVDWITGHVREVGASDAQTN